MKNILSVSIIIGMSFCIFCITSILSYYFFSEIFSSCLTSDCGVLVCHALTWWAYQLYYLFGSAMILLVVPCACAFYMMLYKKAVPWCIKICLWSFLVLIVSSTICCFFKIHQNYQCQSGVVGKSVAYFLYTHCGCMVSFLVVWVALCALACVLWRFFCNELAVYIKQCACSLKMVCHDFGKKISGYIGHIKKYVFFKINNAHRDKNKKDYGDKHESMVKTTEIKQKVSDDQQEPQLYQVPLEKIFTFKRSHQKNTEVSSHAQERASLLKEKLERFGIIGQVVSIKCGPVVTLFAYKPEMDIKLSKIISLEDDLAMALQAVSVRIIAPIPATPFVGFEVSNAMRDDVLFSDIVMSSSYKDFTGHLPLVLGKNTAGDPVIVDLVSMPHLLIAGSTGSGKSVALNTFLMSLLCALSYDEVKLILIDPKRLELVAFADIAHLLFPIITHVEHVAPVLAWVIHEMEVRYEKMAQAGARNIVDYNESLLHNGQKESVPFIVVVIDELADLMITVGRDIEHLITRIAQMARAAGIHMIIATQRPSVDVITGLIKANFPSRISLRVVSKIDSRTILDAVGADRLLSRGDMLFLDSSSSELKRIHGAYVSDVEIHGVVRYIKSIKKVEYLDVYADIIENINVSCTVDDPLYDQICEFLDSIDEVSISLLQRKFRIGYNRAARIIDILESRGLVMPQTGSKMRKVIR